MTDFPDGSVSSLFPSLIVHMYGLRGSLQLSLRSFDGRKLDGQCRFLPEDVVLVAFDPVEVVVHQLHVKCPQKLCQDEPKFEQGQAGYPRSDIWDIFTFA